MATIISSGTDCEILNLVLSSTADIQIGFVQAVNSIYLHCRTSTTDMYVRTTASAGNYFTIPAGTIFPIDLRGKFQDGVTKAVNLWIRASTGTPVVEIIGVYGS